MPSAGCRSAPLTLWKRNGKGGVLSRSPGCSFSSQGCPARGRPGVPARGAQRQLVGNLFLVGHLCKVSRSMKWWTFNSFLKIYYFQLFNIKQRWHHLPWQLLVNHQFAFSCSNEAVTLFALPALVQCSEAPRTLHWESCFSERKGREGVDTGRALRTPETLIQTFVVPLTLAWNVVAMWFFDSRLFSFPDDSGFPYST